MPSRGTFLSIVGSAIRLALRTQCGPAIRGNGAVVRHGVAAPSTKSGAVLLELSRSRMRESGWDQLPPDVRFAGKSAEMRALPWITDCPHQLLTEMPSCEAEHTAARPTLRREESSCQLGGCVAEPAASVE